MDNYIHICPGASQAPGGEKRGGKEQGKYNIMVIRTEFLIIHSLSPYSVFSKRN